MEEFKSNIDFLVYYEQDLSEYLIRKLQALPEFEYIKDAVNQYMSESEQEDTEDWDNLGFSEEEPLSVDLTNPDAEEVLDRILCDRKITKAAKNLFEVVIKEAEDRN